MDTAQVAEVVEESEPDPDPDPDPEPEPVLPLASDPEVVDSCLLHLHLQHLFHLLLAPWLFSFFSFSLSPCNFVFVSLWVGSYVNL